MVEGGGTMEERISQLMDGELEERAADGALSALGREGEARDAWRLYHLIGDAMRGTPLLSPGFASRLQDKLAAEPTVLAPNRLASRTRRWFAIPAAAAAGAALVGWLAFAPQQDRDSAPPKQEVASVKAPKRIPLPSGTPDYLLAHQGFSPRVSLQGMTGYVRTVSDEANGAGK